MKGRVLRLFLVTALVAISYAAAARAQKLDEVSVAFARIPAWQMEADDFERRQDFKGARVFLALIASESRDFYGPEGWITEQAEHRLQDVDWILSLDDSARAEIVQTKRDLRDATELASMSQCELAETKARAGVIRIKRVAGPKHPVYAHALETLAELNHQLQRFDVTEQLYLEALPIVAARCKQTHAPGKLLHLLGNVARDAGKYADGEDRYLRAREALQVDGGGDLRQALADHLTLEAKFKQFDRAAVIGERIVQMDELWSSRHPLTYVKGLDGLAWYYQAAGNLESASQVLEKSIAIAESAAGPGRPVYRKQLLSYAALAQERGDLIGAEQAIERALESARQDDSEMERATCLRHLGELNCDLSRYDLADAQLAEALAFFQKCCALYPDEHARTLRACGEFALRRGSHERAAEYLDRAAARATGLDWIRTVIAWGRLRLATGDLDQAETILNKCRHCIKETLGPDHAYMADVSQLLTELYVKQKKSLQAEAYAASALRIRHRVFGLQHRKTQETLASLRQMSAITTSTSTSWLRLRSRGKSRIRLPEEPFSVLVTSDKL